MHPSDTKISSIVIFHFFVTSNGTVCMSKFWYVQDVQDLERPSSLPEKQAKARAILARTSAASLTAHEQVDDCISILNCGRSFLSIQVGS